MAWESVGTIKGPKGDTGEKVTPEIQVKRLNIQTSHQNS